MVHFVLQTSAILFAIFCYSYSNCQAEGVLLEGEKD